MSGYITTTVDIDIDDVLDELSTQDLIDELRSRNENAKTAVAFDVERDWVRLAELIAEGDKTEALYLLQKLSPVDVQPSTQMNLFRVLSCGRVSV